MAQHELEKIIDAAFEQRDAITPATAGPVRHAVDAALDLLDRGEARVAEKTGNGFWRVNQWKESSAALIPAQRHERN